MPRTSRMSAIITIDPLILPSTVIDYEVGAFVKSVEIDEKFVRSSVPFCPEYEFRIADAYGEELDPDVFT